MCRRIELFLFHDHKQHPVSFVPPKRQGHPNRDHASGLIGMSAAEPTKLKNHCGFAKQQEPRAVPVVRH